MDYIVTVLYQSFVAYVNMYRQAFIVGERRRFGASNYTAHKFEGRHPTVELNMI